MLDDDFSYALTPLRFGEGGVFYWGKQVRSGVGRELKRKVDRDKSEYFIAYRSCFHKIQKACKKWASNFLPFRND